MTTNGGILPDESETREERLLLRLRNLVPALDDGRVSSGWVVRTSEKVNLASKY